jgi:hypothetical protein
MILTNDTVSEKKKPKDIPQVIKKGGRTLAKEFFEDNNVRPRIRTWLQNTTVLIKSNSGNKASGVILAVDNTKTYVLTAKHVLYTLSGTTSPGSKKPADYNNSTFLNTLQIGYGPAGLLSAPPTTGTVSGINFTGSSDQTWVYDVVIFESADAAFRTFAEPMVFVNAQTKKKYAELLNIKPKGCEALNTQLYEFFQLGYGDGRDKDVPATKGAGYTDYSGKFQCKISTPGAKTPGDNFFDIDPNLEPAKWPLSNQVCEMSADVTNSTGPGDSGGPLFSRLKEDKNQFYLVGVTSGANFFSNPELRKKPKSELPADNDIHNNAVTYWKAVFDAWQWT